MAEELPHDTALKPDFGSHRRLSDSVRLMPSVWEAIQYEAKAVYGIAGRVNPAMRIVEGS